MLPLLALIPGLLWTGAKYVGPILESHSSQIGTALGDVLSKSPTGAKVVAAFESILGPITDPDAKYEFTLEVDSMLNQTQLNLQSGASESFFISGARPFIFWGMT